MSTYIITANQNLWHPVQSGRALKGENTTTVSMTFMIQGFNRPMATSIITAVTSPISEEVTWLGKINIIILECKCRTCKHSVLPGYTGQLPYNLTKCYLIERNKRWCELEVVHGSQCEFQPWTTDQHVLSGKGNINYDYCPGTCTMVKSVQCNISEAVSDFFFFLR